MIFRQIDEIRDGSKTRTRRIKKRNEVEERDGEGRIVAVYTVGANGKRRLKWRVGQRLAMTPKRGALGIGYIQLTAIGREIVQAISEEEARAEGVADVPAYRTLWIQINGAGSWSANPEVWVLSFEYCGPKHEWPDGCEWCGVSFKGEDGYDTQWDSDDGRVLRCTHCWGAVAVSCPSCGGEGFVQEDEYENDWINCTDELITCPECRGDGVVAHPSWQ